LLDGKSIKPWDSAIWRARMTWIHVADVSDLDGKNVIDVEYNELRLAVFHLDGQYYATSNICTHASALLSKGEVVGCYIECPAHYGLFDIRTGEAQGAPVSHNLRTYPVKICDRRILVMRN
jgi:nitrite reductase/ring-hydroxylating ferredoxin subunit